MEIFPALKAGPKPVDRRDLNVSAGGPKIFAK
jgi:hypothetical protein